MPRPADTAPTTEQSRPTWDTVCVTDLPKFLAEMGEYFPNLDSNYGRLLATRSVRFRTMTYVMNATHARLLDTDTFPKHSFTDPAPAEVAPRSHHSSPSPRRLSFR